MSVFVSDERFKVDTLLQMARLESDRMKRDEYVREAREILKDIGVESDCNLNADEKKKRRKIDFAKSKLLKVIEKSPVIEKFDPLGWCSSRDMFMKKFSKWHGTPVEFLNEAIEELAGAGIIHEGVKEETDFYTGIKQNRYQIYIVDGEAAQWHM